MATKKPASKQKYSVRSRILRGSADAEYLIVNRRGGVLAAIDPDMTETNPATLANAFARAMNRTANYTPLLHMVEDLREWIKTGKVDGVGFDEEMTLFSIDDLLRKVKPGRRT